MQIIKFLLILVMSWMTSAATFEDYKSVDIGGDMTHTLGKRLIRRRSANQEKRDISLSYSATNIKNKEGTQVKTITVIKNLNDNNGPKLKINPELHKNEDWAKSFKDNFDSYGVIPDVPDIDDLFEYVNKKHSKDKHEKKEETKPEEEKKQKEEKEKKEKEEMPMKPKENEPPKENEKPVTEISAELPEENKKETKNVEKIKDDAEVLPSFNSSRLKARETLTTPRQQYFEKYVQLSQGGLEFGGNEFGYEYPKPCVHAQPVASVTVETPSGRTYNIPSNNNSYINPYLAPSITKRPQIQQQAPPANVANFPINSLVPQLQQANNNNNNNPTQSNVFTQQQNSVGGTQPPNTYLQAPNFQPNQQQQPQQPQNSQGQNNDFSSTSQRPYVAPNIRSGLGGLSLGPGSSSNYNGFPNGPAVYRTNTFNYGFKKPNVFRSRGLKY